MWQYFGNVGFDHVVNIGNILSNNFLFDLTISISRLSVSLKLL
jgi:hypothetical protein